METKKLQDLSFEALCGIIAKVIHNANKAYVDAIGGRAINPTWEEAREEQRQGLVKAVAGTIINPQTPEFSHEQWCLAREKEGWTKDVKYDFNRKTHPNLVPFDQLSFEEQFKSHLYMGIASIFCGGLGILEMPEVTAARKILANKWAAESEENKLAAEEEIDPVDAEATEALREKLKAAQDELDRLEAEQNAKDEEIKSDEPGTVNGVKISGHDPDNPQPENGEGIEKPLPTAEEILDHKPADYTAKDLAEDVLGADKVGIKDGIGSGEIKETPDFDPNEAVYAGQDPALDSKEKPADPKPNLPAEDQGSDQYKKESDDDKPPTAKRTTKKKSADQGSSK